MEQTQIIRREPQILFNEEEIENVAKAHGLSLSTKTKEYLSKGEWSDFIEGIQLDDETLKHGKIKLNREKDGSVKINYQFHQEQLVIPSKIGDYLLTNDDKHKLSNNQVVGPIKYEGNELYIQVDPDLNSVTVRSANEISIPNSIGHNSKLKFDGYTLSDQDKNLLANGGTLSPKLFCGKDGYFTANFSLTEDKKGVVFTNIQSIPNHRVKEVEEKLNKPQSKIFANVIDSANRSLNSVQPVTTLENVIHSNSNIINENIVKQYPINEIGDAKERYEMLKSKEVIHRNRDFEVRKMDERSFALTFSDQDIVYIGTEQECRDKMPQLQKDYDSFVSKENGNDKLNTLRIDRSMCKDDTEYMVLSSMLADGSFKNDPSFPTEKIIDSKDFLAMSDDIIKDHFKDKLSCDPSNISFVVIGEGDSEFFKKGSLHESLQEAKNTIQEYRLNELKDYPLVYSIYVVDITQIREIDSYIGDDPGYTEDYKNDLIATTKKEGILVIPDILNIIEKQDTTLTNNPNETSLSNSSSDYLSKNDGDIKNEFKTKFDCDPENIKFVILGEGEIKNLNTGSFHNSIQEVKDALIQYKEVELPGNPLKYNIYAVNITQIQGIHSYGVGDLDYDRFKESLIAGTKEHGVLIIPDILGKNATIGQEIPNSISPSLNEGDELLKAINEVNPVQVKYLVENGHVISQEHLKALETEKKSVKDQLLGIEYGEDFKQKQKEREEFGPGLDKKGNDLNTIESILQGKSNSPELNSNPDLSREFSDAVDKHNFQKLNELSERGWKPSDIEIKGLDEKSHLSHNDKIAIKTIFNMETKPEAFLGASKNEYKNKQGVKFNNDEEKKDNKTSGTKIKDVINRSFHDM
jgi:hypothetical protein